MFHDACTTSTGGKICRDATRPSILRCMTTHVPPWGLLGIRVHVEHNMNTFMVSTGSCRANARNSCFSQQIGAFRVTRLTMILSAYPTPPVVNQARRSVRGGPHTGQMPLCEAETALSTFLNGRGSCEVPCHKTGVMPGSAAWT